MAPPVTQAAAPQAPIELRTALAQLMRDLPGEYDSEPQRFFEAQYNTPLDRQHARVYRRFTRIDAPALGEHVLVATVHAGDRTAPLDLDQFIVWTLAVDETRRAVRMSPRQFREPARYQAIAADADRLRALAPGELVPAAGVAGCDLYWMPLGRQLRARSDAGRCRAASARGVAVDVDWEWLLNDEELWIHFVGRDSRGQQQLGHPDQTHWRLGKARRFECFLAYRPEQGPEQLHNGISMHDRGDVLTIELRDSRGVTPVHLELIRGVWPSNSGRNYLDLLRFAVFEGARDAAPDARVLRGSATASAASDRAGFTIGALSARCKLPKPGSL